MNRLKEMHHGALDFIKRSVYIFVHHWDALLILLLAVIALQAILMGFVSLVTLPAIINTQVATQLMSVATIYSLVNWRGYEKAT